MVPDKADELHKPSSSSSFGLLRQLSAHVTLS